jgi:hypothetical protein
MSIQTTLAIHHLFFSIYTTYRKTDHAVHNESYVKCKLLSGQIFTGLQIERLLDCKLGTVQSNNIDHTSCKCVASLLCYGL